MSGGSCVRAGVYDVDLDARDGVTINTAGVAPLGGLRPPLTNHADNHTPQNAPLVTPPIAK